MPPLSLFPSQLHGPVELQRDVSCLFVHGRHKSDKTVMKAVEEFRQRNKVEVVIMEKPRTQKR